LAYISVILYQIIVFCSLQGYGILFCRGCRINFFSVCRQLRPLVLFFTGMGVVSLIGSTINLFWPLSYLKSFIIIFIGLLIFIHTMKNKKYFLPHSYFITFFIVDVLFFILSLAYGLKTHDTGLYHLQAVKWIIESPVPFGLANLHARHGFTSSIFSAFAITDMTAFITNQPLFVLNIVLPSAYLTTIIEKIRACFFKHSCSAISLSDYFLILAVIPVLIYSRNYGSFTNDFPLTLLILLLQYLLIHFFEKEHKDGSHLFLSSVITFLCVFAITIKLSSVILIIVPVFFAYFFYKQKNRLEEKAKQKYLFSLSIILLLSIAFLITHISKGFITSGYPFYPHHALGTNAPWSVPLVKVQFMRNLIKYWAMGEADYKFYMDTGSWGWVKLWIVKFLIYERVWIFLTALTFLSILFTQSGYLKKMAIFLKLLFAQPLRFPIALNVLTFLFWFYTAPSPRFAHSAFYGTTLMILCLNLFQNKQTRITSEFSKRLSSTFFITFLFFLILSAITALDLMYYGIFKNSVYNLLPNVDTKKLPFVFSIFIFSLAIFLSISLFFFLFFRSKSKCQIDLNVSNTNLLMIVLITTISFFSLFELPSLLARDNVRLKFPVPDLKINSTNGRTTYVTGITSDQAWNATRFSTPMPNKNLEVKKHMGRTMFIDKSREESE